MPTFKVLWSIDPYVSFKSYFGTRDTDTGLSRRVKAYTKTDVRRRNEWSVLETERDMH